MVKLEKIGDNWAVFAQRSSWFVPVFVSSDKKQAEFMYNKLKDTKTSV